MNTWEQIVLLIWGLICLNYLHVIYRNLVAILIELRYASDLGPPPPDSRGDVDAIRRILISIRDNQERTSAAPV